MRARTTIWSNPSRWTNWRPASGRLPAARRMSRRGRSLALGPLTLDVETPQLVAEDGPVNVPRRELAVLVTLAEADGATVSKDRLLDRIYGTGSETDDKVVEVYVSRLRKRLASYGVEIRVHRGILAMRWWSRGHERAASFASDAPDGDHPVAHPLHRGACGALAVEHRAPDGGRAFLTEALLSAALAVVNDVAISGGDALVAGDTRHPGRHQRGAGVLSCLCARTA